jgi:hypothetical protein
LIVPPTERFQRILLASTAALIAAQPMIASSIGDGPPAPVAGLTLVLGWLAVLAGWGIWYALVNPGRNFGGPIAAGLIVLAGVVALRAVSGTSNGWLASLTAWQWASLPCAYVVTRQLTGDRDDARGMTAALVATGAGALCVHLCPYLVAPLGVDWPSSQVTPQIVPSAYPSITLTTTGAQELSLRAWSIDLFWLALIVPVALTLGLSVRRLPVRRVRWRGWLPLIAIMIGGLVRCIGEPPPAPPSWSVASRIVAESPNGVGPGLFDRFAVRFANPKLESALAEPPTSYLGLAATSGWVAPIVFAVVLALIWREWRRPLVPEGDDWPDFRPRWELQAGAMIGILGGMALQAYDWRAATTPPFVALASAAAIRLAIWIAVFNFAEMTFLAGHADRALSGGIGLVAAVAALYDVLRPEIAAPYWVAIAVALNLRSAGSRVAGGENRAARIAGALIGVGLLAAFLWKVYVPALRSIHAEHHFIGMVPHYDGKLDMLRRADGDVGRSAAQGETARFISRSILQPLIDATDHNRRDPMPPLLRVPWYVALVEQRGDSRAEDLAIKTAQAAAELDFENAQPFVAEFLAHLRLAEINTAARTIQFAAALETIPDILHRDPTLEARLHYQLAEALFAVKYPEQGKSEAMAARSLDESAPSIRYRLSVAERRQIAGWLTSNQSR